MFLRYLERTSRRYLYLISSHFTRSPPSQSRRIEPGQKHPVYARSPHLGGDSDGDGDGDGSGGVGDGKMKPEQQEDWL